jgi:TonB-dependent SusC/RagA subfamily outer membrane receptor
MKIKLFLLVLISFTMFSDLSAQKADKKITITGKVVDMNRNPVYGAQIMIDGKSTGSVTDNEGYYKIKVKPSAVQIGIFTTVTGAKEEPINGRTRINFDLNKYIPPQVNAGKNVSDGEVVGTGYDVSKKKDITKPVTKSDVSGKEYASFSSIYEMLMTVPGVSVSGSSVTIRGLNQSPLFVVNGSVVSSISMIDPAMVKSIEVLKGPSASVYGLQGANGVILIKLK